MSEPRLRDLFPPYYDLGIEEGMQLGKVEGKAEGIREMAIGLLEDRFQTLPQAIRAKLDAMNATQLQNLTFKILKVASLDELFPL